MSTIFRTDPEMMSSWMGRNIWGAVSTLKGGLTPTSSSIISRPASLLLNFFRRYIHEPWICCVENSTIFPKPGPEKPNNQVTKSGFKIPWNYRNSFISWYISWQRVEKIQTYLAKSLMTMQSVTDIRARPITTPIIVGSVLGGSIVLFMGSGGDKNSFIGNRAKRS